MTNEEKIERLQRTVQSLANVVQVQQAMIGQLGVGLGGHQAVIEELARQLGFQFEPVEIPKGQVN